MPKKQGPVLPGYGPSKKTPVAPVKNIYPIPKPSFPTKPSKKKGIKTPTLK